MQLLNFIKLTKVIYINTIDCIEEELLEQKEKTECLIELCNKYRNKTRRYYNLPLPHEIIKKHDNEIGYGKYNNINQLEHYKDELEFYQYVAEQYDNTDFIITTWHLRHDIFDIEELKHYYITPEVRRRVHGICDEIQQSIDQLKKEQ